MGDDTVSLVSHPREADYLLLPMPKRQPLTREVIEELTQRMPDVEAAKLLGYTMVPFYMARKRFGIPSFYERTGVRKRKNGEAYTFHQYDERYFQNLDRPAKAYFLGLIASDGNINSRHTAVRIALKEQDAHILEAFRKELGEGSPSLRTKIPTIKGVPSSPQKILVLSRIAMVEDLSCWGITANKSLTLRVEGDLGPGNAYARDFLRGVWDGDGSVTERRFKVTTGSAAFAEQLQDLIEEVSGRRLPIVKDEKQSSGRVIYHICGYVRDAAVVHSIYGDATLAIERKRQAFLRHWEPRR